jgi:hypothetical protein
MTRTSTDGTVAQVEALTDLRGHVLPHIDSATPLQVRYLEAILLELQFARNAPPAQSQLKPARKRKNAVRELQP